MGVVINLPRVKHINQNYQVLKPEEPPRGEIQFIEKVVYRELDPKLTIDRTT
jgi:hypothetical protein